MKTHDVGIRIRADAKFARLIDKAAELTGQTRSAFIRDADLAFAALVIHEKLSRSDVDLEGKTL